MLDLSVTLAEIFHTSFLFFLFKYFIFLIFSNENVCNCKIILLKSCLNYLRSRNAFFLLYFAKAGIQMN